MAGRKRRNCTPPHKTVRGDRSLIGGGEKGSSTMTGGVGYAIGGIRMHDVHSNTTYLSGLYKTDDIAAFHYY